MLLGLFCIGAQNRLIPGKCSSEYKGWYKGISLGIWGGAKVGMRESRMMLLITSRKLSSPHRFSLCLVNPADLSPGYLHVQTGDISAQNSI